MILPNVPKNCMKLKEFGPPGGLPAPPQINADHKIKLLSVAVLDTHPLCLLASALDICACLYLLGNNAIL